MKDVKKDTGSQAIKEGGDVEDVKEDAAEKAEEASTEGKPEERTFTQEEVNELLGKIRREVREKYQGKAESDAQEIAEKLKSETERADKAEAELKELKENEARNTLLAKVSKDTGVPEELLQGDTEEELESRAEQLLSWAKGKKVAYPEDKGGAEQVKPLSKKEILSIKNPSERLRAIAENRSAFERN